eukprot:SAG25_NODE_1688_length_2548_cov_1.835443_4_plen_49_part_00
MQASTMDTMGMAGSTTDHHTQHTAASEELPPPHTLDRSGCRPLGTATQ